MVADCAHPATVAPPEDPGRFLSDMPPHPLDQLSTNEIDIARDIALQARLPASVVFRNIALEEPSKKDLLPYLAAERNGKLNGGTLRPPRLARVLYDIVTSEPAWEFCDSVVNVETREEVSFDVVEHYYHAPLSGFVYILSFGFSCRNSNTSVKGRNPRLPGDCKGIQDVPESTNRPLPTRKCHCGHRSLDVWWLYLT